MQLNFFRASVPRPAPAPRTLQLASRTVPVTIVRHPRARRYVLRVVADGAVRLTVPRRGSIREAWEFASRQTGWVENQLRQHAAAPPRPADWEVVTRRLWGLARQELPPRVLELARVHGLTVTRVTVRNQRSRWGSCSRRGTISLNWRLLQAPATVRDYVILHELMHLREPNHSAAFWRLVAQVCPEYRPARQWLREHGVLLRA